MKKNLVQKRQKKLIWIKEWKDNSNVEWVECEDLENNKWVLRKEAFKVYEYIGNLFLTPKVNSEFVKLLKETNYLKQSPSERKKLIINLLEAFTGRDINSIFPSIL